MNFINRSKELTQLNQLFNTDKAQLVVVYGRRRIGKTRLLVHFCEGKKMVFFAATRTSEKEALGIFSEQIAKAFPEKKLEYTQFASFRKALEFLFEEARSTPLVLVIDEFPYLMEASAGIDVHLQHLWDHEKEKSNIKIILCGSTLSVMQKKVLGKNAPLYGRRTGAIKLLPLDYFNARLFCPAADLDKAVMYYSIFGGVPFYLEQLKPDGSLDDNVAKLVLDQTGLLYNEPYFLVQEELRDPKLYFAAMHAIASGNTRPTVIANYVGMDSNKIGKYLNNLLKLELIYRELPVTIKPSARSTKGYYQISDPFLRFWFRYVYPNTSAIEMGQGETLWKSLIKPDISVFMGPMWERVCRQYLSARGGSAFGFNSPILSIGRYWEAEFEIDIVAENKAEKKVLFCECKWTDKPEVPRLLAKLKEKSEKVDRYRGYQKFYGVFSRGQRCAGQPHLVIEDIFRS